MINQEGEFSTFIITGMHRSGTSLMASLMQSAGINIGEKLMGAEYSNPKGHFENLDFVGFHEYALRSQGICQEGWTLQQNIDLPHQLIDKAKLVIEENAISNCWGWKDPRTTLFLDFWKDLLPQAYFVFVYRSPWEVVDSLYRRGDEIFYSNPKYALQVWMHYNKNILDFYNLFPNQSILLNIDNVIADCTVISRLCNDKFAIKLDDPSKDIIDKSLMKNVPSNSYRQMLIQKFFPEALELYDKLNNRADLKFQQVHLDTLKHEISVEERFLQDWLDGYKIGKDFKIKLQETQSELQQTQSELQQTQSELQQTQSKLQQTQSELQQTQSELQQTQSELQQTQSELQQTQSELQHFKNIITAMETSKFWKSRKIWFKFKDLLGVKNKFDHINQLKLIIILIFTHGLSYTINIFKQENKILLSNDINYQKWLNNNYPRKTDLVSMINKIKLLEYKPVISIIMPVYNTPGEFLKEAIDSVLNQVYPYWELCIADDASTKQYIQILLTEYINKDSRIKVVFREENGHISLSSNSAIHLATGEYIALLDHDDLLTPHALYEVVKLLNQHPEADMIYSDEDKINQEGKLKDPFFKPDWCPDSFLSRMYTCHLGVYRRELVKQIGGFRAGYEGSQDYDLVLRLTEKTNQIFHIPNVLYHWRMHTESTAQDISTKNYATIAAQKAIEDALERRGEIGKVIPIQGGYNNVRYEIKNYDLISIIIPTKNLGDLLNTCLQSIFEKTTYPHYEILVIDNGSTEEKTKQIIELWKIKEPQRFRSEVLNIPFNFSKINNYAVKQTKGKYLLFLNNDTEVINNDWLDAMVEQAQRDSIGAVGTLLLYPDNTIQHAGVIAGLGGVANHSHKNYPSEAHGYFNQIKTINNYSAVTAACVMCRREVFEEVGGFEEDLAVAFNDIDLCFKMVDKGYKNVYLPHVKLYHYESKSRGYEDTPEKKARFNKEVRYMQSKWKDIIKHDPCYNPNLTREREDFSINV